ncbi:hypothetical protein E2C01_054835 [Portunus trituberculatus]|uniref:Uncharacterized protein n=1 Tax=Portunus trituberculatus TaxID=210409 RepID=A0A5B7GV04_PORTR|nr:hypothetical protein [Portunus trituberculatus]
MLLTCIPRPCTAYPIVLITTRLEARGRRDGGAGREGEPPNHAGNTNVSSGYECSHCDKPLVSVAHLAASLLPKEPEMTRDCKHILRCYKACTEPRGITLARRVVRSVRPYRLEWDLLLGVTRAAPYKLKNRV